MWIVRRFEAIAARCLLFGAHPALLLSQSRIARGEFTPAVGKFAPAAGAFRKCIPCGVVGRPRCVFFAIRLVIEAFLHLTSGFHAKVTLGAMECAA
jgi:hypothetical protein